MSFMLVKCPIGIIVLVVPHSESEDLKQNEPLRSGGGWEAVCLGICGGHNVTDYGKS